MPSPPGRPGEGRPRLAPHQQLRLGRGSPVTTGRMLQAPPEGLLPPPWLGAPVCQGPSSHRKRCTAEGVPRLQGTTGTLAGCPPAPQARGWRGRGSYLAKTFLAMRVRAVSACCFRSVRPGCLLFLPLPLLPALDEPRSTPVATSTSLINSGSCQSANRPKTSENTWHRPCASP